MCYTKIKGEIQEENIKNFILESFLPRFFFLLTSTTSIEFGWFASMALLRGILKILLNDSHFSMQIMRGTLFVEITRVKVHFRAEASGYMYSVALYIFVFCDRNHTSKE